MSSTDAEKMKMYKRLLRAQYTPTKLFNFLDNVEEHQNAVLLYGQAYNAIGTALKRKIFVTRVVSPPVILSYPFDVKYRDDDLVIYTEISQVFPEHVKARVREIFADLKCAFVFHGKNSTIYFLTKANNVSEECKVEI